MKEKDVYLIDGSSFLYRFFFAIRGLSYNGHPTGAIFGFARMLLDIDRIDPEYVAVMFDTKEKTFREDILETYKQNRPPMPDELSMQVEPIKELIRYFGIEIVEKDGYEADDLIATFAEKLKDRFRVIVVANDKDLFQIVDDNRVVIYDPVKKVFYDDKGVHEKLGVYPEQVADYLALVGDSIDNIPGVKSIGPKTARELLNQFGSCDGILENLDKLKPRIRKAIESEPNLKIYRELTKVDRDVPVEVDVERIRRKKKDIRKIREFFIRFGFKSLLKDVPAETPSAEQFSVDKPIIFAEDAVYRIRNTFLEKLEQRRIDEDVAVYDLKSLLWKGLEFGAGVFDIKLACYLLNSDSGGKLEGCFEHIDEAAHLRINELSSFVLRLVAAYESVKPLIDKEERLKKLLFELETPLSYVLYAMEKRGVKVDVSYLYKFKNELLNMQDHLKRRIFAIAGEEFNINSTKELQRILFQKLGIKPIKKTKTGYSTDSETLKEINHEIADLIIRYREISKVISTYIVPFIEKVDENHRLHTTFNQTATSTGRLSSSNPNLQNLPAGEDEIHAGIRKSIVADEGYRLICSDYSQIELRVLAHLSGDEELINIFKRGEDVHTQTAVRLFGIHPSMVDHSLRRVAKTINFGIIYGMGYVSLAKTINKKKSEAKKIIETYFERFKGVKRFIDETIRKAEQNGYVETYFGRRRYFHNINSSDSRIASFEKRAAVNAVIQGTAADIIKIAMVRLHEEIKEKDAHLVLQVHDELLIESRAEIVEEIMKITKDVMENVVKFDVPLTVNIKSASNWLDAK